MHEFPIWLHYVWDILNYCAYIFFAFLMLAMAGFLLFCVVFTIWLVVYLCWDAIPKKG